MWWGHQDFLRETISPSVQSVVRKVLSADKPETVLNPIPPRTILVEGLPKLTDLEFLQGLEYMLLDLLEAFKPDKVALVTGQGSGYVRVSLSYIIVYVLLGFLLCDALCFQMRHAADLQAAMDEVDGTEFDGPDGETYTIRMKPMVSIT